MPNADLNILASGPSKWAIQVFLHWNCFNIIRHQGIVMRHTLAPPFSDAQQLSRLWDVLGIRWDVDPIFSFFFCPSPLPFGGSTVLRLTRGPAGNRTTTGSLSAPSRTTPYQLSHEDTCRSHLLQRPLVASIRTNDQDLLLQKDRPATGVFRVQPKPGHISEDELMAQSKFLRPAIIGKANNAASSQHESEL